jgi:hypothetical protein
MGLPWVRLDTQMPSNPKVLELTSAGKWRAAFVYVASLAYAGSHGTDGYIPDTCLPFIHASKQTAVELVKVGLWHQDVGGWSINGWADFQVCDEEAKARSDKARKAALKRWRGSTDGG